MVDGGLVEVVDGLAADDAADGFGDEPCRGEHVDFLARALQRYGVGHHQLFEFGVLYLLDGVAAQHGVRNHGADAEGAGGLDERGGLADGAARVDDVVEQDDVLACHVADEAHLTNLVGLVAVLVADHEAIVQCLGIDAGAFAAAHVGRGEHDVLHGDVPVADVRHEERRAEEVVHRDVEEALNLVGVQVHRHHAVHAGGLEHVGDELGGDGDVRFVLAVLACEAVVRDDGDNLVGRGALGGVDHHQQFEQVVGGRHGGLDDEHDASADGLLEGGLKLAVGILEDGRLAEIRAIVYGYFAGQRFRRTASENEHFIVCGCTHWAVGI